jgi:7-cyano-7-deazaguanine synthase
VTDSNAVVLLSGGLDSATVLAIAQDDGFDVSTISFRYGQRHAREVQAAERIAEQARVTRHEIIDIDLRAFGGSALTADVAVPKGREPHEMGANVPVTYVPARNTIFLSFALAYAEVSSADHIFIGVNSLDYSGYPDCRREYIEAFETMANLATRRAVEGRRMTIHTPLIAMTKAEIVRLGMALGVDYAQTTSCYDPADDGAACGACDACTLRLGGFAANGLSDPAPYQRA